jgi:energy-converting hydrogenase Eha subunit C
MAALAPEKFHSLLAAGRYLEIAAAAVGIESRTNLLFSYTQVCWRLRSS